MPSVGTAFQARGDDNHIWVVISEPKNGKILVVNFTDEKHNSDKSCCANNSNYCELTKPSVIFYKMAREYTALAVDVQLQTQEHVRRLADCPPELLLKIIEGAKISDEFKPRFLDYFS